MVSKANMIVSFAALISTWFLGFVAHKILYWNVPTFQLSIQGPFGLLWIGVVVLSLCTLFFGRLGFLVFFVLGISQAMTASADLYLLSFFQAVVLAWFGMVGVGIGEHLFEDLKDEREFTLLDKQLVLLMLSGILIAFVVGLAEGVLKKAGEKVVEILVKIRNREFSMDEFFRVFSPDTNP